MYVKDPSGLAELVESIASSPVVAIDTEFMRERTYYARLCLIQIATNDVVAIVDPLQIDDLTPLARILSDKGIVKILHAGIQDIEILLRACGVVPNPVFDTQVAATIAGFPQQVGYGALVREVLDVHLDKGDSYTDWSRRPLSATQLAYAENDVRYLPEVHRLLVEKLTAEGRLDWLADDLERLEDPETYHVVPEEQWRKVKRSTSLSPRHAAVAREVTAWRELEAMSRDIPRRWVLGDETIIEISKRAPKDAEELSGIRGVPERMNRRVIRSLLDAVQRGVDCPEDQLPRFPKKKRAPIDTEAAVDLMVAVVRKRAKENGVAVPLLASRADLERFAAGERDESPLLEGWRRSMVGEELLGVLDGTVSLRIGDGGLVIEGGVGRAD